MIDLAFLKRRSLQAKTVLDDEIFQDAVEGLESSIVTAWRNETNSEKRESLWRDLQSLNKIVGRLKLIAQESAINQQNQPLG